MAEAGADGLVIETMSDPAEIGWRSRRPKPPVCPSWPAWSSIRQEPRPHHDGHHARTSGPEAARGRGRRCRLQLRPGHRRLRRDLPAIARRRGRPVWIKANAGLPQMVDGQTVYAQSPAEFAAYVPALIEAGRGFLGGCCGTTPEFIRALCENRGMNSRQAWLSALNHRQPDRVPIDLGGTRQSASPPRPTIGSSSGWAWPLPPACTTSTRCWPRVERPVLERFGADVVGREPPGGPPSAFATKAGSPGRCWDGTPVEMPGRI